MITFLFVKESDESIEVLHEVQKPNFCSLEFHSQTSQQTLLYYKKTVVRENFKRSIPVNTITDHY